jgi:hemerythrin-like metal-binding protein
MANFFEWDAGQYGLKIAKMDADHEAIIGCMNRLHELHEIKANRTVLGAAFDDLLRVTIRHFADEEVYMQKIAFPDAKKHALIHKQLLERINQFHAEFKARGHLTEEFFYFLKMWLKAHICGIDAKYATHSHAA